MKVPLDIRGILLEQVQREDEANHAHIQTSEIPVFIPKRISWTMATLHALGKEITSFIRP